MKQLALLAVLVSLAVLTACGGSSVNMPPLPPPPAVANASITVSNNTGANFDVAMSTSFQPAEWDYTFFNQFPNATTPLGNLQPNHIRLQGISQGIPQGLNGTNSQAWDFTILDSVVQPVLGVGDHSPEFQIAKAPAFMYVNSDTSNSFNDPNFTQFAGYAKNLVLYYNKGGFTASDGSFHVSPAYPNETITWWGIYNEPSINNNLDATQYTQMYNALVPAMQSADPSIRFVALELCCSSENWAQTFANNVTAHVDVVATHYYSSCDQRDADAQVFSTVPGFAGSVQAIYGFLQASPALANVPVWITENNVNADFNTGNGSACHPGRQFVDDARGSSAFFAAWRPYVFSQVGQAGAKALYHWAFPGNTQFGEFNDSSGQTRLSYWVDYWLGQLFPPNSGQRMLQFSNDNTAQVEVLPIVNADGSVVILISNHAVAAMLDNNGRGMTAKVSLDVTSVGAFNSSSQLTIDATTSAINGPTAAAISPKSPIAVTINGYGVAFLKLQ
jgi:putative glycosyl hydrolase